MTLQVRSHARAKAIAKLIRGPLGPEVQLVRCRVVNRLFAAEEQTGEVGELDRWLDRDVVKRDPPKEDPSWVAEAARAVAGRADKVEALEEFFAKERARPDRPRTDVPLVEDFPMWPEDETDDMADLARTLDFRFVRAMRRWQGEDVTLRDVIEQVVDQLHSGGGSILGTAPSGRGRR
jgi:hypothetical protein